MEYREFLAAEDKQFRAHLEEHQKVIGGVLEEVKAQGNEIAQEAAQAVKASGKEAVAQAQEALNLLGKAAKEVGDAANKTSEMAATAAQRSGEMLGQMDQASQRMLISEQKVEEALNGLLPKVVSAREKLEKELGDMVKATGATEEEVKRMVATIQTTMTRTIEEDLRKSLKAAANQATQRIYNLGNLWERFLKSLVILFPLTVLAAGGLGWWFGQHYLQEGIYEKKAQELKENLDVSAWGMKVDLDPSGNVLKTDSIAIRQILVPVGGGTWEAMVRKGEDWYFRGHLVPGARGYSIADADDRSKKKDKRIKAYVP